MRVKSERAFSDIHVRSVKFMDSNSPAAGGGTALNFVDGSVQRIFAEAGRIIIKGHAEPA